MRDGVSAFRAAAKVIEDPGRWTEGRKMPKTAFPLTSGRSYTLGAKWRWRIVKVSVGCARYHILIAFQMKRQEFIAMLGEARSGGLTRILCRVEHHGSHPGWHVHYQQCAPWSDAATAGPAFAKRACPSPVFPREEPPMVDSWAYEVAAQLFDLPPSDEPVLI